MLTLLQHGIAIERSPFRGYALSEAGVVGLLGRAQAGGLIRRFGGVFDSCRLGYKSMLCAIDAPAEAQEDVAAVIYRHAGVTHCYARQPLTGDGRYPVLWFTIAMLQEHFDAGIAALQAQLPAHRQILQLPALQRFKVEVVFDLRDVQPAKAKGAPSNVWEGDAAIRLTDGDRKLVRLLAGALPLESRPFDVVARAAGLGVPELLVRLRGWQEAGVLRRVAPILYHRAAGFRANGMCVWQIEGDVGNYGRRLAARPEVTHCYQRPRVPGFAFDLFAMIHAGSEAELRQMSGTISTACGLQGGEVLLSTREYKKSSMAYFA